MRGLGVLNREFARDYYLLINAVKGKKNQTCGLISRRTNMNRLNRQTWESKYNDQDVVSHMYFVGTNFKVYIGTLDIRLLATYHWARQEGQTQSSL